MMQRKRWQDLTSWQQAGISAMGAVQLALLGAALWDISHRPAGEINGTKTAWVFASFVNFVGPLAYFIFGRKR